MKKKYLLALPLSLLLVVAACSNKNTVKGKTGNVSAVETTVAVPKFNADSAYRYVEAQTMFGPRVPGTDGHKACGDYLAAKLKEFGASVTEQTFEAYRYDGVKMNGRNIIGSYDPDNRKRILLCAHWDTRPWADRDADEKNYHTPISGANDGASGVGVLLEIARLLSKEKPQVGIDIIFFDAEDSGTPDFDLQNYDENSWCLGSQYWAANKHVDGYNARYGILLDMVGAACATFYKEGFSMEYASAIVNKVWKKAMELGHSSAFLAERGTYLTDDHLPVNRTANIPCINIVHTNSVNSGGSFGEFWHTVNDNMAVIDKNMLGIVGETVTHVIFSEK